MYERLRRRREDDDDVDKILSSKKRAISYEKIKVVIVGGGRIGSLLLQQISEQYPNYKFIYFLSKKTDLSKNKKKLEDNLQDALKNADIIIDTSATDCTQQILQQIILSEETEIISKRDKKLLYFAITPDDNGQGQKTSEILEKNRFTLKELKKRGFNFVRVDKINPIDEFLERHWLNIQSILEKGGKVVITDIHRTEKESFSQVLLTFLVKKGYLTEKQKDEIVKKSEQERKNPDGSYKQQDDKIIFKKTESGELQLFMYGVDALSCDDKEQAYPLEIFSYRSTLKKDFEERGMIGSTHIIEFFDKDGKEIYFDSNAEETTHNKADLDCFCTDQQLVKNLMEKVVVEYQRLLDPQKERTVEC